MIKFLLLVNKQGQVRVVRYYDGRRNHVQENEVIKKCFARTDKQVKAAVAKKQNVKFSEMFQYKENGWMSGIFDLLFVFAPRTTDSHDVQKQYPRKNIWPCIGNVGVTDIVMKYENLWFDCLSEENIASTDVCSNVWRSGCKCSFFDYREYRLVYRKYATLFFIVGVSDDENELAVLEFIHNIVETLDRYFKKVCEMDIMFNLDRVHMILDEMILNGHIIESNKTKILAPLQVMDQVAKS